MGTTTNTHINTTDRLGCRNVLERVEFEASALRAANPRAHRRSVWKEILDDSDEVFLNKIVKTLDLGQWSACLDRGKLGDKWGNAYD